MLLKLGDVFKMLPACNLPDNMNYYAKKNPPKKLTGRVVYIHPQRRFAVLEFQAALGTFCEAFFLEELTHENRSN